MTDVDSNFMRRAIELARRGMETNDGGPFGCVIVKSGKIVGEGNNQVTSTNDPTAHAEVVAIRNACANLGTFQLDGCTVYTSCEPCPMCLGAIYWARPERIFIAGTRGDAADAGFDDAYIYSELEKPNDRRQMPMKSILREDAVRLFADWKAKADRTDY